MGAGDKGPGTEIGRRDFAKAVAGGLGAVWVGRSLPLLGQAPTGTPDWERTGVTPTEVKIGTSAAFKGAIAGLGVDYYRGAQALFEDVNARGGVGGRKIQLVPLDDGYDPAVTVRNTLDLLDKSSVFTLMNYIGSVNITRTLPVLRQYRDRGVVVVGVLSGAQPQREEPYSDQVFNVRASYRRESIALVDEFWKAGARKFGVFYQIDAFGRSGWDGVARGLAQRGSSIAAEATYRRGAKFGEDLGPAVEHLRQAGVDVVIMAAVYQSAAGFIATARSAGWNVPIANISPVGSEAMLGLLAQEGKKTGKELTTRLINSQIMPSPEETGLPGVREYRELVERWDPKIPPALVDPDYKGPKVSYNGVEGFVNAKVVVEALRRAGADLTRARFKTALESLSGWDPGIDAPLAFSASNHQGLDRVYFVQVVGGKWVPLTDWSKAVKG